MNQTHTDTPPPEIPGAEPDDVRLVLDAVGSTAWSTPDHVVAKAMEWAAARKGQRRRPTRDVGYWRAILDRLHQASHVASAADTAGRIVVGHRDLAASRTDPIQAHTVKGEPPTSNKENHVRD